MLTLAHASSTTWVQAFNQQGVCVHQKGATLDLRPLAPTPVVYVRWYDDVEGSGLRGQALLGACRVRANGTVALRDWDGTKLDQTVRVANMVFAGPEVPVEDTSKLIRAIEASCQSHGLVTYKVYADFLADDHYKAPTLAFALHATQLASQCDTSQAANLLTRLARVAHALSPSATQPTLLAHMLSLLALPWAYYFDRTAADQWCALSSFPEPHRAAFDCEDGAHFMLELFHVLQALPSPADPLLRSMWTLAQAYTPYLAVGEILSQGAYVPHCYVVAVAKGAPALVLEPTGYTSGAWGDTEQMSSPVEALKASGLSANTGRVRVPLSAMARGKRYGRLFHLVTCAGGEARFVVCNTDTFEWLARPDVSKVAFHEPVATFRTQVQGLMARMPPGRLLTPSTSTFLPATPPRVLALRPSSRHPQALELAQGSTLYM